MFLDGCLLSSWRLFYLIETPRIELARWVSYVCKVSILSVILFYFFFTRHVSDKDRQSKLYRNVQPVFSIDDEDEDGGIDFIV